MKKLAFLAAGLAVFLTGIDAPSQAGSRYSTPSATVLSPDLTSPWLLQLQNKPRSRRGYSVRLAPPKQKKIRRTSVKPWKRAKRASLRRMNDEYRSGVRRTQQRRQVVLRKKPPAPKPKSNRIDPSLLPQVVNYHGSHKPGTLVVDTQTRFLFLVGKNGKARRYGIGVGKPGFEWAGAHKVSRKAEWPSWRPPSEMIKREAAKGHHLPEYMEGGPNNPLGARALYLGSTLYRIHGTNQPWTIGKAVSSGCIRMRNEDVMDLYERVKVGARVVVS